MGIKIYNFSSLQTSRHCFLNMTVSWMSISKFADKLPEPSRKKVMTFIVEGSIVVKTSLQSAPDAADAIARIMALAVTMRKASWLQNLGISPNVQQNTEDLLFDGWVLFAGKKDEILHSFKESRVLWEYMLQ
ncbi:hypothetical protein UY3_06718 [Chelonia mydas]|uniref:Uncharacterized protein n=1 Tax=Chelonia mydas TaxID=8469 RepID=M7C6C7_CHEMY|nr:hypothetical protein UY3_06718 [Chelonia mydas]